MKERIQMATMTLLTAVLGLCCLLALPLKAEEEKPKTGFLFDAHVPLDETCEKAVARAQEWLASTQRPDGSWNTRHGRKNTGEISFAILALMVNGDVPGEGKYAKHVGKGIQFLLNQQQDSGLLCAKENTHAPMYQHALATLVLSEAYGMTNNPRIRSSLIKAVNLIVSTQHNAGGWRYHPRIEPGDISITVMQVMALRSSAEAGIYVPRQTVDRAIKFIKNCYNAKEQGFGYMNGRSSAGFARTAAGVVSMQTVGLQDDPIVPKAIKYIMKTGFAGKQNHYWYGHYYASVALYHYGGENWKSYYPRIKKKILNDWKKGGHYNSVLDTAWATLVLGVPYRYLPIYQR